MAVEPEAGATTERAVESASAGAATVRGSIARTLAYGASMALSVVSAPFLVRHLGIAQFGTYTTVVSLVAVAGGLSEGGLTAVAVRTWTAPPSPERATQMRDLIGLRLLTTAIGVVLVVAFAAVAGYSGQAVAGTAIAGVGLIALALQQAYSVPLQVELRQGWLAAADVLRQGVATVLILALVVAGATLLPFLTVTLPASVAALLLTVWPVRHGFPLRPAFHAARWRTLVREVLPVAVALTVQHLYLRVVIVLMSLLASAFATGIFSASYRVTEVLIAVPFLISQTTLPVLVHLGRTDLTRLRYASLRLLEGGMLIGAATVLAVVAGAPFIIQVLAGDAGAAAVPVLRLQSLVVLLVFLTVAWQGALFAVGHQRDLVVSNLAGLVAAAASAAALIPLFGAQGGAAGAVIGELCLMLTSLVYVRRRLPGLRLDAVFALRLAAAAAVALAVLLLPLPSLVEAVIVVAVFAGAALLLGAVPHDLRVALADVARRPRPGSAAQGRD